MQLTSYEISKFYDWVIDLKKINRQRKSVHLVYKIKSNPIEESWLTVLGHVGNSYASLTKDDEYLSKLNKYLNAQSLASRDLDLNDLSSISISDLEKILKITKNADFHSENLLSNNSQLVESK